MITQSTPAECEIEPLITLPGLHRSDEVILCGQGSEACVAFPRPRSKFISRTLQSLISILMHHRHSTFPSLLPLKTQYRFFLMTVN